MRLASRGEAATLAAVRIRHFQAPLAVGVALLAGLGCPAAKGPSGQQGTGSGYTSGSTSDSPNVSGSAKPGDSVRFREQYPVGSADPSGTTKGIEPDPDDATAIYVPPPNGSEGRCGKGKVNPNGTCDCPPGFGSVGKAGDARCVARGTSASASTSASGKPSASGTSGIGRCPRGSEICE
jgi:hypothetical protein